MLEKLENKINEEMDKVLVRNDLSLNDIKTLVEIKNIFEMKDFLKESMNSTNNIPFYTIDFEKMKGENI